MPDQISVRISDWQDAPIDIGTAHEFAVGDSHGMSDRLEAVLATMGKVSAGSGHLTLLGDLCDRGPDAFGCYRAAFSPTPAQMGFSGRTGLLGNHEIFLLSAMAGGLTSALVLELWMTNGGQSVRTQLYKLGHVFNDVDTFAAAIRAELGPDVTAILEGLESHREVGNLLFVHAGVDPKVPLSEWFARRRLEYSTDAHFAWIRFPFLGHEGPYEGGRIVVHGHTPEPFVQKWKYDLGVPGNHKLDGWRLGLDGGSYATGMVAGAEFRNGAYRTYVAG